nr:hypothetical protein [Tanacetum cinerariifolium]
KPSISRRNKINWHYVRDDVLFSIIKVVSRHKTTQQYGAILPIELTTDKIRNNEGTGSKQGVPDVPSDESEEELSWNSFDDEDVGGHEEGNKSDESDDDRDEGRRLRSLETSFSEYRQTNPFAEAVSAIPGNKSIQRSDEQRNLYKALVEAYDADKAILDTYGDSTILKQRREDDDQEGPSAGSNRGSKRQKEGGEHASASTPSKKATEGAGISTTGSQSRQMSASESAFVEEPVQTTCQMEE